MPDATPAAPPPESQGILARLAENPDELAPARPEDQPGAPKLSLPDRMNAATLASRFPKTVTAFVGNRRVDLPPDQAQKALAAGAIKLPSNQPLHFRLPDGSYKVVTPDQANQHAADGAQLVSADEHHQADLSAKYDTGFGSGMLAAGLGAARGLTTVLGGGSISDELVGALGAEPQEIAKHLEEKRPVVSGIGAVGGMLAQAAIGNEGGLANLAERGATSVAGEGLAGKVLGQAAKAAVENVQLEHTQMVSEEALGAPPVTAQKYLAEQGQALWQGAAFGAAGALVGEGLGAAKRGIVDALTKAPDVAAIDAVATKTFDDAPKGGLADMAVKVQAWLSGADAEGEAALRNAGLQNLSKGAQDLRATALHIDDVRATAVKDVTEHLDKVLSSTESLADEAKGTLKREQLQRLVKSPMEHADVQAHAMDSLQEARNQIAEMRADPDTFGNEGALKKIDQVLQTHEKAMVRAVEDGDQAGMFAALDDAKRTIGAYSRKAQVAASRSTGLLDTMQARELFSKLGDVDHGGGLYESLRKNLEDEAVWGKAGAAQKEINSDWTEFIGARRALNETGAGVTSKVGERNFGQAIYKTDPTKVEKYVAGLVNRNNDLQHQAMSRYLAASRKLAATIDKHFVLPPEKQTMVTAAKAASHLAEMKLSDIGDKLVKVNQIKALIDASKGSAGTIGAGLIGHMLGGPLGGMLGAAVGQLANPGKNIMRLAQLEEFGRKFDAKTGGAISSFFRRSEKTAAVDIGAAAKAEGAGARAFKAAQTVDRGRQEGERAETRRAYEARVANLKQLQDPTALNDRMSSHYEALQETAPKTGAALGAAAAKAVGYLLSRMPAVEAADPYTGKEGVPSHSEMVAFNLRASAVERPSEVMADMAKGRVTVEQVEALQAAYPDVFQELQGKVQESLAQHVADGHPVSFQQRVSLGILLGIDTDPSLTKPSMSHATATFATAPAPADKPSGSGGARGPSVRGGATKTPEQQMSSDGAM
jgi:hypothetical protein